MINVHILCLNCPLPALQPHTVEVSCHSATALSSAGPACPIPQQAGVVARRHP